jgi:hypothetical protein
VRAARPIAYDGRVSDITVGDALVRVSRSGTTLRAKARYEMLSGPVIRPAMWFEGGKTIPPVLGAVRDLAWGFPGGWVWSDGEMVGIHVYGQRAPATEALAVELAGKLAGRSTPLDVVRGFEGAISHPATGPWRKRTGPSVELADQDVTFQVVRHPVFRIPVMSARIQLVAGDATYAEVVDAARGIGPYGTTRTSDGKLILLWTELEQDPARLQAGVRYLVLSARGTGKPYR